jgi:hypothetical protein
MTAGNLTRINRLTAESGEMEHWLSDVERLGEDDDDWGFTVYGN